MGLLEAFGGFLGASLNRLWALLGCFMAVVEAMLGPGQGVPRIILTVFGEHMEEEDENEERDGKGRREGR